MSLITKLKHFVFIILMILMASFGGVKAYIDHQLRIELDSLIKSVADILSIKYTEVNSSLLGSVYINNLRLATKDSVHIDTVTIYKAYQFYISNPLPQHVSIAIQGIQIPVSDTSTVPVLVSALGYSPYYTTPRELRDLGMSHINADIYLEAELTQQKIAMLGTLNAHAWGKLNLSTELTNIFPFSASKIQLARLMLEYNDAGLSNRILTKLAQRSKMTLSDFKQMLLTKLRNDTNQLELDKGIFTALQQFIKAPSVITVHLQPRVPMAINALLNASPKHLGLKIISLL